MKIITMYEMYHKCARLCCEVYEKNIELKFSTEYSHKLIRINNKLFQVITIAGTNDFMDMFKNINLLSWAGIKLSAYKAAGRIHKAVKLYPNVPIIVTGHSLGGGVAIAYKKRFKADYCIAFAPARVLRYWTRKKMKNTIIFTDPDDCVSELLGALSFCLPDCKQFKAEQDHNFYSLEDHKMKNWVIFTKQLLEKTMQQIAKYIKKELI